MSLILHIDTATETAHVAISEGDKVLVSKTNTEQKQHASFVQPAIEELLKELSVNTAGIEAVCVTGGPGSYTGIRVGMASAKGICYALDKPLIILNTLEVMAHAVLRTTGEEAMNTGKPLKICPMIDARRMEVFTALYDTKLHETEAPRAMIIEAHSFDELLEQNEIIFSGSGAGKLEKIIQHSGAKFAHIMYGPEDMAALAYKRLNAKQFDDLAYSSPLYVKEFFDTSKRP